MPSADPQLSPSPPLSAPTASTPGPRAVRFIQLYNDALSKTLKSISYESFASCFPSIAEKAPESLRTMHGNFVSRLGGFAEDEFETILTERSVVENLNKLEDLLADAKRRKACSTYPENNPPIPPHTLPAPTILSAHLQPYQNSQQSQLNAKIQTVSSQNADLVNMLLEQRSEIESLVGVLEGVVRDLESAGSLLQGEVGELSKGSREAEEGMVMRYD